MTFEEIGRILDLDGSDIAGRHWQILGCSGITGAGLAQGFDWIVDDISSRVFILS